MLPDPLQQFDRTWVLWQGEPLAYFGGSDYLRMASHPKVLAATEAAIHDLGLNVSASRRTTGNHELYERLEAALASFFQAERALVISNGYLTNAAAVQGLAGQITHIFIDEKAHMSLTDAAHFAHCPIEKFAHRDPADLAQKISKAQAPAILTDGMFSNDGSVAPLADYLRLLPERGWIIVDDAHAAGVLGDHGRGSPEVCNVPRDRIIQTVTLSKGFGAFGGAVLCDNETASAIMDRSACYTGATPPPLPYAAGAVAALELAADATRRARLNANTQHVRRLIAAKENHPGPLVSVVPKTREAQDRLTHEALRRGVYARAINYPPTAALGYFRFAISSEHTRAQLDALADAITSASR